MAQKKKPALKKPDPHPFNQLIGASTRSQIELAFLELKQQELKYLKSISQALNNIDARQAAMEELLSSLALFALNTMDLPAEQKAFFRSVLKTTKRKK